MRRIGVFGSAEISPGAYEVEGRDEGGVKKTAPETVITGAARPTGGDLRSESTSRRCVS
jgi:hypothetical protein